MTRATITAGAVAVVLILAVLLVLVLAGGRGVLVGDAEPAVAPMPAVDPSTAPPAAEDYRGFLYGRVVTHDDAVYEGRLRFGGAEEAFWGDYFNGAKTENRWAEYVPPERLKERVPIEIFGFEIGQRERRIDLGRPFMVRFGDILRIEARGGDLRVILKGGTVVELDRFGADDFADGVRVWDDTRGVVDLDEWKIGSIEFLPTAQLGAVPDRLHGTVHTRQGEDFTGFLQWNRQACVGTDELVGRTADGELRVPFDTVRSIARSSSDSSVVTLVDGREIELSNPRHGHRGIFVDDPRYGRVLVSWDAFERVDSSSGGSGLGGSGPAYEDFPTGRRLTGSVTTRAGRRLAGRLVYDLDESETLETLDAPFQGVDYSIPFGLVASIALSGREGGDPGLATVTLQDGEALQLERTGDLGEGNAGLLVFVDGREPPEYVPWAEVERVELDRSINVRDAVEDN